MLHTSAQAESQEILSNARRRRAHRLLPWWPSASCHGSLLLLLVLVAVCSVCLGEEHYRHHEVNAPGSSLAHLIRALRDVQATPGEPRALPAGAQYQYAKLQQEEFCRGVYPLALPGTKTVQHATYKYNATLFIDNDIVSSGFQAGRGWEDYEVEQMLWAMEAPLPADAPERALLAAPTLLDIGANLGTFSFAAASRRYQVLSVEGSRTNQLLLRHTLCANPQLMPYVTLYATGVGEKDSTCHIVSLRSNHGNGNAVCGVSSFEEAVVSLKGRPADFIDLGHVHIHPIDSMIQQEVKVLKMDVEGFEPRVMMGARRLLSRPTIWYFMLEFNLPQLKVNLLPGQGNVTSFLHELHNEFGFQLSNKGFQGPFLEMSEVAAWQFGNDLLLLNVYGVRTKW